MKKNRYHCFKRCHEKEWYLKDTGHHPDHNHCGSHITIDGIDYCTCNGEVMNIKGVCGSLKDPEEQTTLF